MSSPHYPKVGFTFDQENVETTKAPHHSSLCTEDQSHTQILLPPLKLHDPITHALEESYILSTCARRRLSLFLSFTCMSQSRVCICLTVARSAVQHHEKPMDCMPCTCTHLCSVDTFKHGVCLYSFLYLSCLLVRTNVLLVDHAFTNMGQPMR